VKDFEDKMLLLDIYQQYGGTIWWNQQLNLEKKT
jgi:hypothetical protein